MIIPTSGSSVGRSVGISVGTKGSPPPPPNSKSRETKDEKNLRNDRVVGVQIFHSI